MTTEEQKLFGEDSTKTARESRPENKEAPRQRKMPAKTRSSSTQQFEKVHDYHESEKEEYDRKKKIAYALVLIVVVVSLGVITALATWFALKDPPPADSGFPLAQIVGQNSTAAFEVSTDGSAVLKIALLAINASTDKEAVVKLAQNMDRLASARKCSSGADLCYNITSKSGSDRQLELKYETFGEASSSESELSCVTVHWLAALDQEIQDCIPLGSNHWFGGGLLFKQRWPMQVEKAMTPFLSADILQKPTDYGSVLEPYWLSSHGVAVSVDWNAKDQPLHTSWNANGDGQLCLASRFTGSPYKALNSSSLELKYSVCVGRDIGSTHKAILKYRSPWPKPSAVPEAKLFTKPIWSTWVSFKHQVNQQGVEDFVKKISSFELPAGNIEVDDGYQELYGDFTFNTTKFPSAKELFGKIKNSGYDVTLWVYPFINYNAKSMDAALDNKFLVMDEARKTPAMTWWWPDKFSKLAGMIDFTNPAASSWYFSRLKEFQEQYGIHSFKFDAGENNWTPACHSLFEPTVNPEWYGRKYAEDVTAEIGNGLEVRVGLHTQHLPIFVRMLDKDSVAGYENGLKTLIPTALVFGILGYPFVLPDMVGGNAYKNSTDPTAQQGLTENQYPSRELFLRWAAATVFMPSIQFSITPWYYDELVNDTQYNTVRYTRDLLKLREPYEDLFRQLADESVQNGHPIIRPLWWNHGEDKETWTIDDQFMVGDKLMVAPLLEIQPRKYSRSVYLPAGKWLNKMTGEVNSGPGTITVDNIEFDKIPFFELQEP